jgi:hypothetical protein
MAVFFRSRQTFDFYPFFTMLAKGTVLQGLRNPSHESGPAALDEVRFKSKDNVSEGQWLVQAGPGSDEYQDERAKLTRTCPKCLPL